MILLGSLDLDPGSQGKPMNSWCVSFETECNQAKHTMGSVFSVLAPCIYTILKMPSKLKVQGNIFAHGMASNRLN